MAARTFEYVVTRDPEVVLQEAKEAAAAEGIAFRGTTTMGNFSGKGLRGRYKFDGERVAVTILAKPVFVPWSYVEEALEELFRGPALQQQQR